MGGHSGGLGATIVSRGKGHSAVSKAAYIGRCSLENERLGTRDDYSRKSAECLFSGIYAPKNAPAWTGDREQLWNHVEAFEKRKDSQLARELLIDLAHELTPEQNRYVLQDFIRENFTRKGLIADAAIHAPHQHSDERNIHAHVMIVLRHLDGTEFEAAKPRQTEAENVAELNGWKRAFEKRMNKELEKHGHEPRWDMRSNAERGLNREPEVHLGKAAAALERGGTSTAPGDLNREIRERNRTRERAPANENDHGPAAIEAQREELARLEAMAAEYERQQPGHDPTPSVSAVGLEQMGDDRTAELVAESERTKIEAEQKQLLTVEPARPPIEIRLGRSRLLQFISAGWERLASLVGRLEQAFAAVLQWHQIPAKGPLQILPPVHQVAQNPDQVHEPTPEPVREGSFRARLRVMGIEPMADVQAREEATREPPKVLEPTPQPRPDTLSQAPENERAGLFGWFRRSRSREAPQPETMQEVRTNLRYDHAGENEQEPRGNVPAERPAREPEPPRPVERFKRDIAAEIMQEAKAAQEAKRARETVQECTDREAREAKADLSRSQGDGGRQRTRHRHSLLKELFHPFHDHRRRHRRP